MEKSFGSCDCSANEQTLSGTVSVKSPPSDPGDSTEAETVFPLQVTPFKWCSLSLSLRFLTWLKSPDFRLRLDLFLSATSLLLLLTFLGSLTFLGGAGLNCGLVSAGYRPKLGLAPKMAEALRPLHDDGSGRLRIKTLILVFDWQETAECSQGNQVPVKGEIIESTRISRVCGFNETSLN